MTATTWTQYDPDDRTTWPGHGEIVTIVVVTPGQSHRWETGYSLSIPPTTNRAFAHLDGHIAIAGVAPVEVVANGSTVYWTALPTPPIPDLFEP